MRETAKQQERRTDPKQPSLPTLTIGGVGERNNISKNGIEQVKSGTILSVNGLVKGMTLRMMNEGPQDIAFIIVECPIREQCRKSGGCDG